MNNLYITYRSCACLLICLLLSFSRLNAQTSPEYEPGVVRLKVSEELAAVLESRPFSRNASGEVITGVEGIDRFNRIYKVREFRPVFRRGGSFEQRHRKHGLHRWYELKMGISGVELQAVSSFRSISQVDKAEPAYRKQRIGFGPGKPSPVVYETSTRAFVVLNSANDPLLSRQWHYNNTGQSGGTAGADISLFDAWKRETGSPSVVVAVTDGGVQVDHPDLSASMWKNDGEVAGNGIDDDLNGFIDDIHGFNFVTNDATIYPDDHGTHVAGTIAAVSNNGIGVSGIAGGTGNGDGVRVMSCAVFSDWSSGGFAESYVYAADNGALISQNSWGYTLPNVFEEIVLEAIDYFIEEAGRDASGNQVSLMNGGMVIFAAGNSSSDGPYYPAYYEPTFSVTGTTHRDTKAWYSNYGTWTDIAAPGGETNTVENQGVLSTIAGGTYGFFQGTSMACPHVSGVAALVLSKFGRPGFNPEMLRERLRRTSFNIDALNPGFDRKLGAGRIDADKALDDSDITPPLPVTDLSATNSGIGEVTLSWTTPVDENSFVASYDIRYSFLPIDDGNADQATSAGIHVSKVGPGESDFFVVSGLPGNTTVYFAVIALDFQLNATGLSNVSTVETWAAPTIVITPSSVVSNLKTAETEIRNFVIRNEGAGHLDFSIPNSEESPLFAICSPSIGSLSPGEEQLIEVTFRADQLFGGRYEKSLVIRSNDPLRQEIIVPAVLNVTDNGFPIARWEPQSINFKSVKTGTTSARQVVFSNGGTEPLRIEQVIFDNEAFSADSAGVIIIEPFMSRILTWRFSPSAVGGITAVAQVYSNDPNTPVAEVTLTGEGLDQLPVEISPGVIDESVQRGSKVTRSLVIRNNGSYDRTYSMEVVQTESGLVSMGRSREMTMNDDSLAARITGLRKKVFELFESGKLSAASGLLSLSTAKSSNAGARTSVASPLTDHFYQTDFEEFDLGAVDGQHGWFAFQDWRISNENPARGKLHLRGGNFTPGMESFVISPSIFGPDNEEFTTYTSATTRVDLSNATGGIWQIVPQDPYFVVTRIVLNLDRTIDVMSIGPDYEILWNRINYQLPNDYLDIAIELNSMGYGTSGFPTFDLFFNHQKVFHGYSLGTLLDNMAFVSTTNERGGMLDIDGVMIRQGAHTPNHIFISPSDGVLPAGEAVEVSLEIDATSMKFGVFNSTIITLIDEFEELVVPARIAVIGEGSINTEPSYLYGQALPGDSIEMQLVVTNTGGQVVDYRIEHSLPGLIVQDPLVTLAMQERREHSISFETNVSPGIYFDTLIIYTSLSRDSIIRKPLRIIIWEQDAAFAQFENVFRPTVYSGEVTTIPFEFSNDGEDPMDFLMLRFDGQKELSIDPERGSVGPHETVQGTITIDARNLPEGYRSNYFYIETNDLRTPYADYHLFYTVLPNRRDGSGKVEREVWSGVPGRRVSSIPVNLPADTVLELDKLDGPVNTADNYGARIRGYIKAPVTGSYTFWIASDDQSQLLLSNDELPAGKKLIASVNSYVPRAQYEVYSSQKSQEIELAAGEKYYFEILHKENTGRDHISVGWQLPDGSREFPIGSNRISRFGMEIPVNEPPMISLLTPEDGSRFTEPASVQLLAEASDPDGSIIKVEFYVGNQKIRTDAMAPYIHYWSNVPEGEYKLMARAYDNLGAVSSTSVNIQVVHEPCAGTGTIERELWRNVSGRDISSIPLGTPPNEIRQLSVFEASVTEGDQYGSRIRGYVCVPLTGYYTFWIASDDNSELWLSPHDHPGEKQLIASVTGYTLFRQWNKYVTQQSAPVLLKAGYRYYIEALHKEAKGKDHVSVGWRLPDGSYERPISGSRLIPFELFAASPPLADNNAGAREVAPELLPAETQVGLTVYPNPSDGQFDVTLSGNDRLVSIQLVSVAGLVVYARVVNCEDGCRLITIQAEQKLNPGVYVLHVRGDSGQHSVRVVVR